jgi:hypothetical protein
MVFWGMEAQLLCNPALHSKAAAWQPPRLHACSCCAAALLHATWHLLAMQECGCESGGQPGGTVAVHKFLQDEESSQILYTVITAGLVWLGEHRSGKHGCV